jgi:hypothetical protein
MYQKWQNYKFVISKLICRRKFIFIIFCLERNFILVWDFFVFIFSSHTLLSFFHSLILSMPSDIHDWLKFIQWERKIFKRQCKMSFECHTNLFQCVACEKREWKMEVRSLSTKNFYSLLFPTLAFQKFKGSISICCFILKLKLRVLYFFCREKINPSD